MMSNQSPAPLVLFRVLANQGGVPAGLLIDIGAGDEDALLELFQTASFQAFGLEMPAYYREGLPAPVAEALAACGWSQLVPGSLLREDEQLVKEELPAGTLLIEGDWCMAAPPKATGAQAASRALALQLAQLVASDAHTHDIEALLRKDPTLSYHLLRLVNSLGIGAGRKISSFSQAILILGRQQLRRWVNLMLFAARQGDPRSGMLLARVAVRGRLLELLTKARGHDKAAQDQAFITGMFSLLGVLFGMPLPEVLAPLSISDVVAEALLESKGELGLTLKLCEAAEEGNFAGVMSLLNELQIDLSTFNAALIDANHWMIGAVTGTHGSPIG
jgi:EAL and modified HD-GYP domain-containing signal transduction protein